MSEDTAERIRALTDLESTLLVEAAAGTGKTALIAGRLTMLLASGCAPTNLAAITFTEAAASELSERVHRYVDRLLEGEIPTPLRETLPAGLSETQRKCLSAARDKLEELTTSTIHGFCQSLILSYAVEADIDPGAQIIDATQAKIAFDAVFDRWLRHRLSLSASSNDPIAVLSKADPTHVVSTVRDLARFRLEHRTARSVAADLTGRPDVDFTDAVRAFTTWQLTAPSEQATDSLLVNLETLAAFYQNSFESEPDFEALWRLAHPPRVTDMPKGSFDLKRPQTKSAWQKIGGATEGPRLHDEAMAHFTRVDICYRTLLGKIATALVEVLSTQLDEVLNDFALFKRNASVFDFDDLLYRARDLVLSHDLVRVALGQRYSRILVDEFQDTDPIQAEILFRIAAIDCPPRWEDSRLRDGALFVVGDPKQAIYRFRGADIEIYERARSAIRRHNSRSILHITSSFRSKPEILAHVNRCFAAPLSASGQPGYVPLTSTREENRQHLPCVAKRTIELPSNSKANEVRDAEAGEIADICARLIGNMEIVTDNGTKRPLMPADIALLAPTGTELRRYERALDERGLPYASQAGKNLFDRQEIHDLVCLGRVLADPHDTLAFGALMRGPLVGLTEEELLDITGQLPAIENRPELIPGFSLLTDPEHVSHALAREVLTILRELRRRAATTTPMLLLGDALERLHVRALLAAREGERSTRALANIDMFLELARGYDVRGIKQFVRDASIAWIQREARAEGRIDTVGDSIEIVTIHSSKGLEWPVVFLINTVTMFRSRDKFVHRPSDDTLHWVLGDVVPPNLYAALETEEVSAARERERLMYVAYTRARDLLVLPKVPHTSAKSWTGIVYDPFQDVTELDVSALEIKALPRPVEGKNEQTAEVFTNQQRIIEEGLRHVSWLRPSLDDLDREPVSELLTMDIEEGIEIPAPAGAGRLRGLVLHKLMEEVLTGELGDDAGVLISRARELLAQLALPDKADTAIPDPEELGATIARTLALPEIAELRCGLVPEVSVFGTVVTGEVRSLVGRADAVFIENNEPRIIVDWKSDIEPSEADIALHAAQLRAYMRAAQVIRGALVYFSSGRVRWLTMETDDT